MCCERISVKGEGERIADSARPRSRKRHGKRLNPFSTRGLDIFESVCAELSAKREYIAKKTGAPEALVRFADSKNGWIPVVIRAREGIGKKNSDRDTAGVSIVRPVENNNGEKDGEFARKQGNRINGESESISISDERSCGLVMPLSRILKTTAFGILGLTAISVRRSAVPMAAAMAVGGVICMKRFIFSGVSYSSNPGNPKISQNGGGVEAIAQKKTKDIDKLSSITPKPGLIASAIAPSSLLRAYVQPIEFLDSVRRSAVPVAAAMAVGGAKCMKRFILSGVSYSSMLFRNPGNPNTSQIGDGVEAIALKKKKDIDKLSSVTPRPGLTVSAIAPSSPLRAYVQPIEFFPSASSRPVEPCVKPKEVNHEHKYHHHDKSKAKTFRVMPMENRSTRPARPQESDSFYRKTMSAMSYDASAGATAMIITLFCLAFCGRLCAIFFTSAWWYLLPMSGHHSERKNRNNNNNNRVVDLQSSEHRKKATMDVLLQRKHN